MAQRVRYSLRCVAVGLAALLWGFLVTSVDAFVIAPRTHRVVLPLGRTVTTRRPRQQIHPIQTMTVLRNDQNEDAVTSENEKLPFFLDIGTKGGVIFLGLALFVTPLVGYSVATNVWNVDDLVAGKWIGGIFTGALCVGWASSLLVRIFNKDMTYAKQLKDYENAVLAKRLEELDEDEKQALIEDVERDNF